MGLDHGISLKASILEHLLLKGSLGTIASRENQYLPVKCAGLDCGVARPLCLSLRLKG